MTAADPGPALGPNPNRVRAGRLNRAKRGPVTPAGRERLRQAALAHRPWEKSTGPRTVLGKARSAENGRVRQVGPVSVRQARAAVAEARGLVAGLRDAVAAAGPGA